MNSLPAKTLDIGVIAGAESYQTSSDTCVENDSLPVEYEPFNYA